jgi:sialate O-acetylesterase
MFQLIVFALCVCASAAQATLWTPSVFGDHMVLQTEKSIRIWGKAVAGETVTVEILSESSQVLSSAQAIAAASDRKWEVVLPEMSAGQIVSVRIVGSESSEVVFSDVLTGEVWLCSGQSNMRWRMDWSDHAEEELAAADYPDIRLFLTELGVGSTPLSDCTGEWQICSSNTVGIFSGPAYFFGRELHQQLARPVGLILCAVGGTPVQAWTPLDPMLEDPDTAVLKTEYDAYYALPADERPLAGGTYVYGAYAEKGPARLYNGMIHPFIPFALRGVAWCQAEANDGENEYFYGPELYRKLFPMMIRSWRENWGGEDFPFLYVELANYMAGQTLPVETNELSWANIREAQASGLVLPNVYPVSVIDIGLADDIHYTDKQTVGRRLAKAAFGNVYHTVAAPSLSPRYVSHSVSNGVVRLRLKNAQGLTTDDEQQPAALAICGTSAVWYWAECSIDGTDLLVWSPEVAEPVAVRHAWADNPAVNTYNSAGLPMMPFRTDAGRSQTYEAWAAQNFSSEQFADPAVYGQTADADGDGIPNLMKYAMGIGPFDSAAPLTCEGSDSNGLPVFSFLRSIAEDGSSALRVETAASLTGAWSRSGELLKEDIMDTYVSSGGYPAKQKVQVSAANAEQAAWFARLAVDSVVESRTNVVFGPDASMSSTNWFLGDYRLKYATDYVNSISNTTDGNPDDALKVEMDFTATSGTGFTAQMVYNALWSYTPSESGRLVSFDLGLDAKVSYNVAFRAALIQDGNTYWSTENVGVPVAGDPYITYAATTFVETDFIDLYDGVSTPDFSESGSEITFGLIVRRGDSGTGSRSLDIYLDNADVTLTVISE